MNIVINTKPAPFSLSQFPNEIAHAILLYVGVCSPALKRLNKTWKNQTDEATLLYARQFEYPLSNSVGAGNYLKAFFLKRLIKSSKELNGPIPNSYFSYKQDKTLAPDQTLQNLKNLTTEIAVKFFEHNGTNIFAQRTQNVLLHYVRPPNLLKVAILKMTAEDELCEVKKLLQYKIDPNFQNMKGETALTFSAIRGQIEMTELLLQHGANPHLSTTTIKATPLYYSAQKGHKKIVELLLAHNADVNHQTVKGYTALHESAESGYEEITQLLLQYRADVNIQANCGSSALYYAVANRHLNIVKILLLKQPNLNLRTISDDTILIASITSPIILRELLKAGADPNFQNHWGETALARAASQAHAPSIRLLLQYKADPDLADDQGNTPLTLLRTYMRANPERDVEDLELLLAGKNAYLDYIIDEKNKTFHIVKLARKPQKWGSALATLKKIEKIIKNNFKYSKSANNQDEYKRLNASEILQKLNEQAAAIKDRYTKKISKLSTFCRMLFGNKNRIENIASTLGKKYFDFAIVQDQVKITESPQKPQKHESALFTLKKIKEILDSRINPATAALLRAKADEIYIRYRSKRGWYFFRTRRVEKAYHQING